VALLGLVLLAALLVARTCGSNDIQVSQEEAKRLAIEAATFTPCTAEECVRARYVPRGIPVQGYWAVVLYDRLDANGRPNRIERFLVNVESGAVTRS
jgi:hypothetical protein